MWQRSASMNESLAGLREDIIRFRFQNVDNQKFIDVPRFREMLTEERSHRALRECGFPPHQCREYTTRILKEAYPIFALLIYLENLKLIKFFLERSYHEIPIQKEQLSGLNLVDHEKDFEEKFLRKQFTFKPHYFHRDRFDRIGPSSILPITAKRDLHELEGSFGAISEIVIASSFHNFSDNQKSRPFIQKRIRRRETSEHDFEKERDCLGLLREIKNPNIVPLLYSYTFKDEHYLIFPRISMDLSEFLRQKTQFGNFSDKTTFYTAFQGLASALNDIHNLTLEDRFDGSKFSLIGYHHDIRPANVLVTPETFLLADFGLSKFIDPDQRKSQTKWKCGKGDYIAPECYGEEFVHANVGRAIDIWALGCMVIDITTYMEDGLAGLKDFRASRQSTFKPRVRNGFFFHEDILKSRVTDHLNYLQSKSNQGVLWSLVETTRAMLAISPHKRSQSIEVYSNFTYCCTLGLFLECKDEIAKCIKAAGREIAVEVLGIINYELLRLISWGHELGLSIESRDPQKFIRNIKLEMMEPSNSVKKLQQILAELRKLFGEYNAFIETADPKAVYARRSIDPEEQLRNMTTKCVGALYDVLPDGQRKEATSRAQEHFRATSCSKSPSQNSHVRKASPTVDSNIIVSELALSTHVPSRSPGPLLVPGARWFVWDARAERPVSMNLTPSRQHHSLKDMTGNRSGSHPLSVLECIGFDPERSVKARYPAIPIHDLLQPSEKFRVV